MNVQDIIKKAIDLHVHIGPEIIPRKFTAETIAEYEDGKISGIALKNHFSPTTDFIKKAHPKKLMLIGSVTLNNYNGGLDPEAVIRVTKDSKYPIIVWFPTIHAKNFLERSEFEIPPEWVQRANFKAKKSSEITPVEILSNGKLNLKARKVLEAIKQCNAILATGHLTWQEAEILANESLEMEIKTIITHPIYQRIDMPVEVQRKLGEKGAFIEMCYSMHTIDKIPIQKIVSQLKAVGPDHCIISSDVGQAYSKSPSEALTDFITMLNENGITTDQIKTMLVDNPRKIISINK